MDSNFYFLSRYLSLVKVLREGVYSDKVDSHSGIFLQVGSDAVGIVDTGEVTSDSEVEEDEMGLVEVISRMLKILCLRDIDVDIGGRDIIDIHSDAMRRPIAIECMILAILEGVRRG